MADSKIGESSGSLEEKVEYDVEQKIFSSDERAVYEEALKHITQETNEEDLPKGGMSVLLLKHQKIALAWMLSKENCSHCPGGILADDQVTSHFCYHIQIAFNSSSYQVPLCLAIDFDTSCDTGSWEDNFNDCPYTEGDG